MKFKIFISSVQDEFAEERRLLKGWLTTDPFVSRFVESVFLFEDQPSTGKSPEKVFTDRAAEADIYIGLLGAQYYGKMSVKRGVSATEREFDAARKAGAECLAYVRNVAKRDKRESDFIGRVGRCVTWSSYAGFPELRDAVFGSLVDFLDKKKLLLVGDFDCEVNPEVRVSDISSERVAWYIEELHAHGKKSIPRDAKPERLLKQLGMLKGKYVTNAGLLLFGTNPQTFFYQTTVKCVWCAGTEYERPFLDTAKYEGDLFALRDQARNFVLSRIAQSRGIRDGRPDAPSAFEIPYESVEEAIVNALVHRNWHSSASIEIRLFADRLEIWSPGHLPPDITIPELYEEHESHPVNKEILKAFDKINAMESLGSGISRIIGPCRKAGLPTPLFEHRGAAFVVTILKNRWTKAALSSLGLNERQIAAVEHVKNAGSITLRAYLALTSAPHRTAVRELQGLVAAGIFLSQGAGRSVEYVLNINRATFVPIVSPENQVHRTKPVSANKIKGQTKRERKTTPQESGTDAQETAMETTIETAMEATIENLGEGARKVYEAISKNPTATLDQIAESVAMTREGVFYHVKSLRRDLGLRHEGPTKKGRWVFNKQPVAKKKGGRK